MAYIGVQPAAGQYRKLDDISAGFNGTSTTFTTSVSGESVTAGTAQQLLVSVGGVIQEPKTDYDVSTNSIVFTTAPAAGLDFFAVLMGDAVNTITVPDGSVTTAKLAGSLSVGLAGGTNSAPTLFFTGDTNTGVYSPGADQVAVTTGGTQRLLIDASGNVNVDSNTLYVDAANNRVGIGTSSVSRTLDVVSTDTWIRTARTGGNAWIVGTGVQDAYRIYDDTAGAERFRIDTSGRVGIGSTAPTNSLEVVGGATSNLFAVKASSSGDCLGVTARSAGNGAIVSALNSAQSDYEPLEINGEIIYFQTRTGAGTVSERARIDSSGRLLVGTSTALTGTDTQYSRFVVAGNTSGASAGIMSISRPEAATSITTDEVLGIISFADSGAGEYGRISCAADANAGTNDYPGRLVFSTTADGASSPTERMRIGQNGKTTITAAAGVSNEALNWENSTNTSGAYAAVGMLGSNCNNTSSYHYIAATGGSDKYYIYGNGTTGTPSDINLKKNIETTRDGYLEDLCQLRVVKYNWNEQEDGEPKELGVIAQELEQVFPGLIQQGPEREDGSSYKAVKTSVLPFMLLKALQEAAAKIETLEARLTALEAA